jgi:hypothetical protein
MRTLSTIFHLQGRRDETISVTVNGTWPVPGVDANASSRPLGPDGSFRLSPPREALGVKIDFARASGDEFLIRVAGSEPGGDVSECTVRRRTSPIHVTTFQFDVLALLLVLCAATASAQEAPPDRVRGLFDDYIEDVLAEPPAGRRDRSDPGSSTMPFLLALVSGPARDTVVSAFESQRVAKQIGAPAPASGSTSVAVRGDSPSILGLAFEHGLITGARTGESVTFRGNLVGIAEAGARAGFLGSYQDDGPAARWLRKVSFSLSFDPGSDDDASIDPDADRLTGWSARLDLRNERDPRHPAHEAAWSQMAVNESAGLLSATNEAMLALWELPEYRAWRTATLDRVGAAAADDSAVRQVLEERIAAFRTLQLTPDTQRAVNRVAAATLAYLDARAGILDAAGRTPLLVFEYASQRPADQPRTSDLRVIAEVPLFGGSFVANAAAALFDEVPAGADRLRHVDVAAQWDLPLQQAALPDAAIVLTLAARVQHLASGIVFADALVPDTEGTIGVVQVKATVPIRALAIRIPVSVTWANRSELVKETFVRGQVGVTFDFDGIVARGLAAVSDAGFRLP